MTLESNVSKAVPIPSPSPLETSSVVLGPFGLTALTATWNRAVKLVEAQPAPGCKVDSVLIGKTLCENKLWENRRVERNVTVTANVSNTLNDSTPCKVLWFFEEVAQYDDKALPTIKDTPTFAQTTKTFQSVWPRAIRLLHYRTNAGFTVTSVSIGANKFDHPQSWEGRRVEKGQIVSTTVNGQTEGTSGEWVTEEVPQLTEIKAVPVNQVAIPSEGPPPQNMAPGMQYVQHVSGPVYTGTGDAQYTTEVNGQIIQQVGSAAPHTPQSDEYMVLLSSERCRMIATVLRGGIIMQQENAAILFPLEQALATIPGQTVKPGANERVLYLRRNEIEFIISMIKGLHMQMLEGLTIRFHQAATGG